jgi:hypothetical protein
VLSNDLFILSAAPLVAFSNVSAAWGDGRGLSSLKPGFDHAVLIILTALAGVCVTQVNFDPCDLIAEMDKCILHQLLGVD